MGENAVQRFQWINLKFLFLFYSLELHTCFLQGEKKDHSRLVLNVSNFLLIIACQGDLL